MMRLASISLNKHVTRETQSLIKTGIVNWTKPCSYNSLLAARTPVIKIEKCFHTTPRNNLHPLLLFIFKPISRVASILSGRFARKWWQKLTPEKKQYYKTHYLKNPKMWAIPVGIVIVGGGLFYVTHLQTTPITNRTRFIGISEHQILQLSEMQVEAYLKEAEGKIVNPDDAVYDRVSSIVNRMANGNQDVEKMKSQKWTFHIIDQDICNAFVLPNGHIFVYTGLLKILSNDDQLAFILGHEMAHAILSHGAEKISFSGIADTIVTIVMGALWALMPGDGIALITNWCCKKLFNIMLELPYSRTIELEADKVGLHFASKACFDVREGSVFWRNWAVIDELRDVEATPLFLSTHPSYQHRARELDKLLPEALEKRQKCNCPELTKTVSKIDFKLLQKLMDEMKNEKSEAAAASAALVK